MASINQVVTVTLTPNSRTPSRAGFGKPLLLVYTNVFADLWREYGSLAEMILDGFSVTSKAYRMAASLLAQDPTVASFVVGRLGAAPAFTQVLTMTSAVEGVHVRAKAIDSNGDIQQLDYPIPASATLTTVATAFEVLVEALVGVASTASVADITVTSAAADGFRPFFYDLENVTQYESTADADYDDALTVLETSGKNDWYFLLADSASPANVAKIAAWVLARNATNPKLYFTAFADSRELDGTGTMGSALKAIGNGRTVLLNEADPSQYGDAAWVGVGAPKTPGSINWANKQLIGVTPKDLTTTQQTNLETDNINHYQAIAGLGAVRPGVVTSGEWIDIVHGTDALRADMQETVWGLIASSDKIAYTDQGIDLINSMVLAVLKRWEDAGLLVKGSSGTIPPSAAAISAAQKKTRRLPNFRFFAKYAGAINAVDLVGTLDY